MSNEEEEDSAANIGVGKYPCMPSLVALQQMRNRLHLANLGKKLMKWTALATGKEIRKIAADLMVAYGDFAEEIANCYMLLARSRYYYPNLNKMVLEDIQKEATITVGTSVKPISAGVKGVYYEVTESDKPPYPHLGIDKGGQTILEAKIAWANLLKKMILILQLRNTYVALDDANRSATKKQNVLAKLVVPKLLKTIKYIMSELEELEREDNFRLKTFKKSKMRAMAAKGQGVCTCCLNLFQLGDFEEIDKDNLTCPKCKKGTFTKVSAKVVVCENVGDKVMQYLEDHKDEIDEWAKASGSILTKPCCKLADLSVPPGTCMPPETLDVSFTTEVKEIPPVPIEVEEIPPVPSEVEEIPPIPTPVPVQPEPCLICTPDLSIVKPEPYPEPCPTCTAEAKVDAQTEPIREILPEPIPARISCQSCKASMLDNKPCAACQIEKEYLEDLLKTCIPCKRSQDTRYDGYKNIKFTQKDATVPSTPCSIPSRITSGSSYRTSKRGETGDVVEKVIKITRTTNPDGTVDEHKQIIIKTKLIRTGSAGTSSLKSRSWSKHSKSPSCSLSRSGSRVKYAPSNDTTAPPCSCQYLNESQRIDQCIKHSNITCDCGISSNKLETIFNTIKARHDKAIATSTTSLNKRAKSQPSGDQKNWDAQSDVLKQSSQMYSPKVRSCISENEMYTLSELESRGIFEPSNTSYRIPFKSQALKTAKNEMSHRSTPKEGSDTKSGGSVKSNKTTKTQKYICDTAFVSNVRKDNKLPNKLPYKSTSDSKLWLAKSSTISANNVKTYQTICKECLKELCGYIPPRTDNERHYPDCKYCQKKQITQKRDSGTSPDSKSSIFLSCTSASLSSLGQLNVELVSSQISLKNKESLSNPIDEQSSDYVIDQEPGFSYRMEHNLQRSNAPHITNKKVVEKQKDDLITGVHATILAHKNGHDIGVDSLMNELYRNLSIDQRVKKINDLSRSLSSLSYETNDSKEGTTQQKETLQKCNRCKRVHDVGQYSCTSSFPNFIEDKNKSSESKYKTNYEIRNIFVTDNNLFERSPKPSPDTSPNPSKASSDIIEKYIQTCSKTNRTEEGKCDGFCDGNKNPETWVPKPVEASLYRKVRDNDPTAYKHLTIEPEPVTTSVQCCLTSPSKHKLNDPPRQSGKNDPPRQSGKNPPKDLCPSPISRNHETTPICCDKTCTVRQGVVDPDREDSKVIPQNKTSKQVATNNITGETGRPHTIPSPESSSRRKSEPKFKDASTNTKRSGRYDVRALSQIPKLEPKASPVLLTECAKIRVLTGSTSYQSVSAKPQSDKCIKCIKYCKSCSDAPRKLCFE
ncbi:ATP synthase subunit D domain-containing protein [Phthorimaea operculella]|nr:ATP synthase subunit D domain-containing protein [Phthorimaea operculella]